MTCENCIHSVPAQNKKAVACRLLFDKKSEKEVDLYLTKWNFTGKEYYQGYSDTTLITWTWLVPKDSKCDRLEITF